LLLTGDAAYSLGTIRRDLIPLFVDDEHKYLRSLNEIRRYTELTPEAVVISGHDPENWSVLRELYA
jgi:glyoxylase-like metal-dependent hydrolase (beta-lactamase superfamily II)